MTIIHGTDTAASRAYYQDLIANFRLGHTHIRSLPAADLTLPQFLATVSAPDLFSSASWLICLENFFARRDSHDKKNLSAYFLAHPDSPLLLWEQSDVSSQIKSFPPGILKKFDLPKALYSFLESFRLGELRLSARSLPPELILASLAKHLSSLILAHDSAGTFPDWQRHKLKRQSEALGRDRLDRLNTLLLDLDFQRKNSASPLDLMSQLELWCLQALT